MICSWCTEATSTSPCGACGREPRLGGRHALLAPIGEGAAATTWKARAPDGSLVAVKELPLRPAVPRDHLRGADPLQRLGSGGVKHRELVVREAAVLRQLAHVGIPAYIEHLEQGHGRHRALYIVQEFIEGPTLAEELHHHRYREDEVLALVEELLQILSYLHGLAPPVIHRDLKPSNVMRRGDGQLALVDFGCVRDAVEGPEGAGSTVVGTFGYMAPEQLAGRADARTDLYGLGALAVALLTRREPRTLLGPDGRLRWRPHASVSHATALLLDDLLQPDPSDRPPSADAVLTRLLVMRARGPRAAPAPPRRQGLAAFATADPTTSEPVAAAFLVLFSSAPLLGLLLLWPVVFLTQVLVHGGLPLLGGLP